jgi:glutathione reductase (NADPH)
MSTEHYDLIGVGTGVASIATRKFARDGRKVALIDNRPPGGTCALRGCTPKKILAMGAEALDLAHRLNGKGLQSENLGSSWSDLRSFMNDYTDPIPENNKRIYAKEGATFIEGTARFTSPTTMAVLEPDGTEQILSADRFVLTTGARPRPLAFPGNEHITISDDFFELESLPRRILFLGGGFISMEFAHIASRYGSECHVVQRRDYILAGFEHFLTEKLLEHSINHHGIKFHLNSEVKSIERRQDGLHVQLTPSPEPIVVDAVIHGAGRIPNVEELDLAAGEIEATPHGIRVNEFLNSTTNPRVYAAGDCADTGVPHLTLVAGAEGNIVYRNLVEENTARVDYRGIASIVFTLPQLASAGLTEHEAREAGHAIEVREQDTARWFTNRLLNWGVGGFKIIIDRDSDRLLGAHFLGHKCEEFINVFALAIRHGITREELKKTLWGHPSSGSDMGRILGTRS